MGAKKNFKDGEKKKKKKSKSNGDGPNINKASKQSFKPSNDAIFKPKPQQPLQLEDDEVPDFPRGSSSSDKKRFAFSCCLSYLGFSNYVLCAVNFSGGGSSLSQQEREEIYAEVDAEFEAEQRGLKKRKKGGKRVTRKADDDIGSLFGDGITGKLPRFANKITFKVRNCN